MTAGDTPDFLLLDDFAAFWRMGNRSHKTIQNYLSSLRRLSMWLHAEGRSLMTARKADLGTYLEKRLAEVQSVTVHGDYKAMRAFYDWLVRVEEELEANPASKLAAPSVPESERYIATETDFRKLLAACDNDRNKTAGKRDAAILALLWTGLRRGEVTVLDIEHVSSDGLLTIPKTKSLKVRTLGIPEDELVRRLSRWVRLRIRIDRGQSRALFIGKKGRLTPDTITDIVAKRRDQARLPKVTAHSFRRGRSTDWLSRGGSETGLMAHMGWTSTRMVARYTREQRERLAMEEGRRLYDKQGSYNK